MTDTTQFWKQSFHEAQNVLKDFFSNEAQIKKCQKMTEMMVEAFKAEKKIYSCGNGGSFCDAHHFAEELTGRFRGNRAPLGALALGAPAHITCVANDFGFEEIFSRQVEAFGTKGDLLLALSTSGNSPNIIKAVEAAHKKEMKCIGLLGKEGGALKNLVDLPIIVPSQLSDRIQEIHIKIIHISIETTERMLFPENY